MTVTALLRHDIMFLEVPTIRGLLQLRQDSVADLTGDFPSVCGFRSEHYGIELYPRAAYRRRGGRFYEFNKLPCLAPPVCYPL